MTDFPTESTDGRRRYGDKALLSAVSNLGTTGPGGRHNALNAAAFSLGRLVPGGALTVNEIAAALRNACEANGYLREAGERGVAKTIQDGLAAGMRSPKQDWKPARSSRTRRRRTVRSRRPAAPVEPIEIELAPEPTYPPRDEVKALWEACVPLDEDPEVVDWLSHKRQNMNVSLLADLDVARVCQPDRMQGFAWPTWAGPKNHTRYWRPHPKSGLRLVVPLYDAAGEMRSLLFRRVFEADDPRVRLMDDGRQWPPKSMSACGKRKGLVMACPTGRTLLKSGSWTGKPWVLDRPSGDRAVLIAEGEMDLLSALSRWNESSEWPPAVFGYVAGGWNEDVAARVPDGTQVVVAVDGDSAGDGYVKSIARQFVGRSVSMERWSIASE